MSPASPSFPSTASESRASARFSPLLLPCAASAALKKRSPFLDASCLGLGAIGSALWTSCGGRLGVGGRAGEWRKATCWKDGDEEGRLLLCRDGRARRSERRKEFVTFDSCNWQHDLMTY